MIGQLKGLYSKIKMLLGKLQRLGEKLLGQESWILWVIALLVLLLLVYLLVRMIRKRRRRKAAEAAAAEAEPKVKPPAVGPKALVRSWKAFVDAIPRRFRPYIKLYEHFLVLGESDAGKSFLIDNYTDWKGQARQFYPSYVGDPLIQFYLGSRVVVHEISSTLLNDTSEEARTALSRLWRRLFKKRMPTVIVALNSETLSAESPDSLKKLAQLIRGKLNLISMRRNRPVQVCIVLTFMNHIEGCAEFFDFLIENQIPLRIDIDAADPEDLAGCLEPYEQYLSRALLTLPAEDYLKIITFMRQIPEIFTPLSEFVKVLQHPDPLSADPEIFGLSLTTDRKKDVAIANPFAASISHQELRRYNPVRKHQAAAGVLLLLGLGYLLFGYFYQRNLLMETERRLDLLEADRPTHYSREMHAMFPDSVGKLRTDSLMTLLPDYFPQASRSIRRRLLADIRDFFLLPRYHSLRNLEDEASAEQSLYLLGLLYASDGNRLGALIRENIDNWITRLDLPEMLVRDYINESHRAWGERVPVDLRKFRLAVSVSTDPQPWMIFFNELENAVGKDFITGSYLEDLREKARTLLDIYDQLENRDFSLRIIDLLKTESPLSFRGPWIGEIRQYQLKQNPIRDLLAYVREKDIRYPSPAGMDLAQLLENLQVMAGIKGEGERRLFSFFLSGKSYSFASEDVDALMTRSRVTLLIRDFSGLNDPHEGLLFFREESDYPDILLNPGNSGELFFVGKARVDGKFTRKAFDEAVRPPLLHLSKLMKDLPIAGGEKVRFGNYVLRGVKAYTKRYVFGFKNLYDAFHVEAEFPGALRYVLREIQQPASQFQEFLLIMEENTALEIEEDPFLRPFALGLREFASFRRLMREEKGVYPELEKYKTIMGLMLKDLEADGEPPEEKEGDPAAALKRRLGPLGRMSLAIHRNEEDSYLRMIRMWLDNIGITYQWERLFLEPVHQAHAIGIKEVETFVKEVWRRLDRQVLVPVSTRFPFDMNGEDPAEPEWLKGLIHTEGVFWRTFNDFIAPLVRRTDEGWRVISSPLSTIDLPGGLVKGVGRIESLTGALWDEKGEPKPIRLEVKPALLPSVDRDGAAVVLGFLKSGTASAFAFNQQPTWEPFPLEWWKRQTAAVGVEFAASGSSLRAHRVITVGESYWSFHRLMRKAKSIDKKGMVWEIADRDDASARPFVVRFRIRPDPWKTVRLSR